MDKIKVLIVDDSALVRQTLVSILESDPQIEIVGVAENNGLKLIKTRNGINITWNLRLKKSRIY